MRRNSFKIVISLLIVTLLYSIAYLPVMSKAAVVWSDNFDDGNYDGWTDIDGTFTAENGYLENTAEVEELADSKLIYHNNSMNSGTWSFDAYTTSGASGVGIWIKLIGHETLNVGLGIVINWNQIRIMREDTTLTTWNSPENLNKTWIPIDVTVDEDERVNVFVNGTHRIHYQGLALGTTNPYFKFHSFGKGQAIDNVVLNDTIDYDTLPFPTEYIPTTETTTTSETTTTTTTTTTTSPTDTTLAFPIELLAVGAVVAVIIVIVAFKLKRS